MSTSKTGKHGHAKCHFVALDIFTQKKMDRRSQAAWFSTSRQKVAPAAAGQAGHWAQQEVVAHSRT